MEYNKFSKAVTQDPTQPAAQAMLHAIGLTDKDFKKPLIGIASTGYEGNPCNMHLNDLSVDIKKGVQATRIDTHYMNTPFWKCLISICQDISRFGMIERTHLVGDVNNMSILDFLM